MAFVLLAALVCVGAEKPKVPLEESCRKAVAILVVKAAADPGKYKVLEILHDGTGDGIKKDAVIAVDLKGMVYGEGKAYILFLKPTAEAKRYQAVEQTRTEDGKDVRERVQKLLASTKGKSRV